MSQLLINIEPTTATATPEYWLEKLSAACRQAQIDTAALGLIHRGETISVSYRHPLALADCAAGQNSAFCVAKLFTSTLIALLVRQGKARFEDEISKLLPFLPGSGSHGIKLLEGVTVSHLLSHTHGLGSTNLDAAPVNSNGFIDAERVLGLLQKNGRIFAPGKFYSYGVEGYILLGLLIELVTQKTYSNVLREEILAMLGDDNTYQPQACPGTFPPFTICPSSGRGLALSMPQLLTLSSCFLNPEQNALKLDGILLAEILKQRIPMPGWSPTISGACYGWKAFPQNWRGQNGLDSQHMMYVRINPVNATAICLVAQSTKRNPGALPAMLLQGTYPELGFNIASQPAILSGASIDNDASIIGTYGNCHSNFRIGLNNERLILEVASANAGNDDCSHQCYLYPAENNVFFLSKPWQYITFLQLVRDGSTARYLWDNTQLWPLIGK